jgi:hypothetical protein
VKRARADKQNKMSDGGMKINRFSRVPRIFFYHSERAQHSTQQENQGQRNLGVKDLYANVFLFPTAALLLRMMMMMLVVVAAVVRTGM